MKVITKEVFDSLHNAAFMAANNMTSGCRLQKKEYGKMMIDLLGKIRGKEIDESALKPGDEIVRNFVDNLGTKKWPDLCETIETTTFTENSHLTDKSIVINHYNGTHSNIDKLKVICIIRG